MGEQLVHGSGTEGDRDWGDISLALVISGVSQGSSLIPVLFNIVMNNTNAGLKGILRKKKSLNSSIEVFWGFCMKDVLFQGEKLSRKDINTPYRNEKSNFWRIWEFCHLLKGPAAPPGLGRGWSFSKGPAPPTGGTGHGPTRGTPSAAHTRDRDTTGGQPGPPNPPHPALGAGARVGYLARGTPCPNQLLVTPGTASH